MKRIIKLAGIVLAVLLAAALCLAGYAAWRRSGKPLTVSQWDMPLDSGRDVMHVSLSSFSAPAVSGLQKVTTVNRTGADLDEIVLRVFANGGEASGMAARAVDVTGVYINDEKVSYAFDREDPTVLRIEYPWAAGEEITLRWHINASLTGDMTLITLPVLAVHEDGMWRTDAWDPLVQGSCAQAFDLDLRMEYNQDIDVLFGGALLDYGDDPSGRISHVRMLGARDVTLLVTKGKTLRFREAGGVKIAAAADGCFAAERLLDLCGEALASLSMAGIDYPFPALTIAQLDTGHQDGFASSAMILLPEEKDSEAQLRCVTRLIARQTFGVLAGNDAWREPWLRYSLSSAAELLAYRARKGETAYETRFFEEIEVATRLTRPFGVTVGADVSRFGGDVEMTQVLRDQGGAMLMGIAEAMGEESFVRALNLYAQENAFSIAQRQDFEAALESVSGSSWSGYLEDELAF